MEARQLLPVFDLTPYLGDGTIVAFNVGPEGTAFVVLALNPPDKRTKHSFAKNIPQRYRVLSVKDGTVSREVTIDDARFAVHHIQPIGDDFLLVGARSAGQRNGHFFDQSGHRLHDVFLGDGIASVQVTASGTIWTSYFDEGVFGNDPVGASGLVAWNREGQPLYQFVPSPGLDSICDCYALNVESDDATWCYYYTEFPLVRLRHFRVDGVWQMPLAGSPAFAVWAGHALFAGGYHEKSQYSLFALPEKRSPELLREFEVFTSDGVKIDPARAVGRGDSLWLLHDPQIYRLRVENAF